MYYNLDPQGLIQELPAHQDKDLTLYCFQNLRDEINILKIDDDFTAELVKHLMYLEVEKG